MNLNDLFNEEKVRLDPKCWTGKKIGNPKTKVKGGVRVNNCVPAESVAEGSLELNTPDPVVVVQDLKGNILDKINLSVAAQKYKLGQPQNIKNQLAHQNYTKVGNYTIVSPMSGQPQDATTQGVAETELDEKSVSQAQFRTMAGAAHNPEFARKVGISQDVAQEFNQADKKSNYKKLPARATEGSLEEVDRRGFLKGLGAAAVAGSGLAPEKAQSNILIPILHGLLGADIPRSDVACAPRGIELGQKVSWRGETQEVIQIYGEHRYCKNPDFPIAVKVGKLAPGKEPIDTDLEQKRKENMARMANSGSSNTYLQRIAARIKPNIAFSDAQLETVVGNPVAEVEVQCAPDGSIIVRKLIKSSGHAEWDQAVIKAIDRTRQLPRDIDGNIPTRLNINFRPKDTPTNERVDQGMSEGEQQKGADYRDPKEVDYDDEYDAMVARVKKLAGLGPLKTVYDPAKRQYRNMPTAQQPKK